MQILIVFCLPKKERISSRTKKGVENREADISSFDWEDEILPKVSFREEIFLQPHKKTKKEKTGLIQTSRSHI